MRRARVAVRTLLISDLHLGSLSGADVLRHAELRAPLLEAAAGAERVVLLGDVLELRQGPPREALAAARGFFEDLGRALGGGELIIVAGNHDHALIEPWVARRGEQDAPDEMGLEQLIAPADASPMLRRLWFEPSCIKARVSGSR